MIGGGTGPATGTAATTCTPGAWNLARMLQAAEAWPMNFGLLGKGNAAGKAPLEEQIAAGACGLKLHEDWGTTPAAIDTCLKVADDFDIQVAIHTDTINEAGFLEATIAAIGGRAIHTYHTEGAGGGHAPVYHQHYRRTSRHADGVPSPEPAGAGGCCVRRKPHPPRDHCRRGYSSRFGRDQHDFQRLASDGPRRRSGDPHLANRTQNENAARRADWRFRAQ